MSGDAYSMREALIENMRRLNLDSYEVGGCIRDELLGKQAKDIDFAVCGVTYDDLVRVLEPEGIVTPNVVGERLVGCRLLADWTPREGVEISLARTERSTESGRANFDVSTDPRLGILDDLGRRDFTVNAIARSVRSGQLVDPFGGALDIAAMKLRVIGPDSFHDDPSRILRGLVRVAKDGFIPDSKTLRQMQVHAYKLAVEPAEQIYLELDRLLAGDKAAQALRIGRSAWALQVALPELAPIIGFVQESQYHDLSCDEHTFEVVDHACRYKASQVVRWAALFHDSGKPASAWRGKDGNLHFYRNSKDPNSRSHEEIGGEITRAAFNRLQQPPMEFRIRVIQLVEEHMFTDSVKIDPLRARRFIQRVGRDRVDDLLLLRRCDREAKGYGPIAPEQDAALTAWEDLVAQERNQPLMIKDLVVGGHDALALGFEGKEIGALLNDVLFNVTDNPELNTRESLLPMMERRAIKQGKTSGSGEVAP